MASDKLGNFIREKTNRLFTTQERVNMEDLWRDISIFVLNNQSGLFESGGTETFRNHDKGQSLTDELFDSTAIQANQDLAASVHSTLTNPTNKWSQLRFKDEDLNNASDAVAWIEKTNDLIHEGLSESNFNTEVSKGYRSLTSLGNMALMQESKGFDDDGLFSGFLFKAIHLGELSWLENAEGIVDKIYRKYELSAGIALERWGDSLSVDLLRMAKTTPEKDVVFLHSIFPREPKDIKLNEFGIAEGKFRPFASVFVENETGNVVEETGFYEFPIFIPRFETTPGEVYGRGPGHIALPDIKTLNKVKQRLLEAAALVVRPPSIISQRDIVGDVNLFPGSHVVVKGDPRLAIIPYNSGARIDVAQLSIQDLRQSVREMFFLDKLLLPPRTETGEMTAFEIAQRIDQMQRVLGPTLGRLNAELLSPLIQRSFNILFRGGALPPLPPILQERGVDVDVVFVNQLARAQQIQDVTNIRSWIEDLLLLSQTNPQALDSINVDGAASHIARIRGIPEAAIANTKEIEAIREARAQQAQQQQALDAGVKAADIAAKTGGLE